MITENTVHWIINTDLQLRHYVIDIHQSFLRSLIRSQDDHILFRLKNTSQVSKLSFERSHLPAISSPCALSQHVIIMIHYVFHPSSKPNQKLVA